MNRDMEILEDYVILNHPNIVEEYKRKTTPFYYEGGVEYHPITSGMGCGSGGSKEPFTIHSGDYQKDGDIHLSIQSTIKKDHRCSIKLSEAHLKIKRFDESVEPIGSPIKNSKRNIFMCIDGYDYIIIQSYYRNYKSEKLGGRVFVYCEQSPKFKIFGTERIPYYELYSVIGDGKWNLKYVKSYETNGNPNEEIKFNVSVREFKKIVFGNPNLKIKCDLFGHL